jgi:pimeloyl-ACP methyl ester carboxylesterase
MKKILILLLWLVTSNANGYTISSVSVDYRIPEGDWIPDSNMVHSVISSVIVNDSRNFISYQAYNVQPFGCTIMSHAYNTSSAWIYRTVRKRVRSGQCVITFDLPGHGESDNFPNYLSPFMVARFEKLVNTLVLKFNLKTYNIAAWSDFGNVAIQAMSEGWFPGLENFALISTAPINLEERNLPEAIRLDTTTTLQDVMIKKYPTYNLHGNDMLTITKALLCHNNTPRDKCEVPNVLLNIVKSTDKNVIIDTVQSRVRGYYKDEINILYNRGDVKLCFFYAENDAFLNPKYMESVANLVNAEFIQSFKTGHSILYEDSYGVNKALDTCFDK